MIQLARLQDFKQGWNSQVRPECGKNCAKRHIRSLYVNLGGDIFWFGLFPSVAQLSSAFPYLPCFPNAADMLPLSSSWTSITSSTITLLTNQRPRKDKTEGQMDRRTERHYYDQCPGSGRKKTYLCLIETFLPTLRYFILHNHITDNEEGEAVRFSKNRERKIKLHCNFRTV